MSEVLIRLWKCEGVGYVVATSGETAAVAFSCDPEEVELVDDAEVLTAIYEDRPSPRTMPEGATVDEVTDGDDEHIGWAVTATAAQWAAFNGLGVLFSEDV